MASVLEVSGQPYMFWGGFLGGLAIVLGLLVRTGLLVTSYIFTALT